MFLSLVYFIATFNISITTKNKSLGDIIQRHRERSCLFFVFSPTVEHIKLLQSIVNWRLIIFYVKHTATY